MMWQVRWLNRSVAIINATLQFLEIYKIFTDLSFGYNIKINADKYVKLKTSKMNS